MSSKLSISLKSILLVITAAFLVASCGPVRYTYYKKHNVPSAAGENVKFAKAIPSKPFLAQSEAVLKEIPEQDKNVVPEKADAKVSDTKNSAGKPEPEKISSGFDTEKFFREHKLDIKKKGGDGMLDDRTTIIVLLVILILVLLALVGDNLLWLLWLALVVLLILALIKYLGLFG